MRYILIMMFLFCVNLFSQYATNDAYTPPQNNNNTAKNCYNLLKIYSINTMAGIHQRWIRK